MLDQKQQTNYGALSTLVTVFFFWGFIAAGNSIFIPFCKHYFHLDQFQSQLIDFAFYTAYYVGALILFAWSFLGGMDLVGKWGYKKSIVYGLLFSALGAAAMIAAVKGNTFTGMLIGLFIVALGFSLQQTSAQPFIIALGDPSTGSGRVNLGGAINSLGTTVGPIAVAFALFGTTAAVSDEQIQSLGLNKVVMLYIGVGLLFIGAAALFGFSKKVPSGISEEKTEKSTKALTSLVLLTVLLAALFIPIFQSYKSAEALKVAELESQYKAISLTASAEIDAQKVTLKEEIESLKTPLERKRMYLLFGALIAVIGTLIFNNFSAKKNNEGWGAMKYPQLVLGMIGIFVYVGVEVSIGSNLSELLKQADFGGMSSSESAPYIAMYWGSLMIGRWAGAISVFNLSKVQKNIMTAVVPILAFAIVLGVIFIAKYNVSNIWPYILCVFIQIGAFYLSQDKPAKTLFVFSILGVLAMLVGVGSKGQIAVYAFLSGGLCCSIMWPCIFALSITGLGKYTTQGSAFLIMMILGGGVIPPIQGKLADIIGIHHSYVVAAACFAYLAFFAFVVRGILARQGFDYEVEKSVSGGH